jgi:hypothetical protein
MRMQTLGTMLMALGILAGLGWSAGQTRNQKQGPGVIAPTTAELTAAETENILRLREEEKLARDVYLTLAEAWVDCPIFTKIAAAEQRHMDAVGLLLTKYNLPDPVTDDTVGVFSSGEFSNSYTTLTASGTQSLLDALQVGVQIEEADIADLQKAIAETNKSDIQWVLGNLLQASFHHLNAFTRCLETGGTSCQFPGNSAKGGASRWTTGRLCPGCGGGGRGNGNGYHNGGGNGNQDVTGQGDGRQNRDGSCLISAPART